MKITRGADAAERELSRGRGLDLTSGEKSDFVFGEPLTALETVARIVRETREGGDAAIRRIARAIDGSAPSALEVPPDAVQDAVDNLDPRVSDALTLAADRIRRYHEASMPRDWMDFAAGWGALAKPCERVGVYVPGGSAPLPSTALMTAIPARVAGVDEIILCSPARDGGLPEPTTLAAAQLAPYLRGFGVGGQAFGARYDGGAFGQGGGLGVVYGYHGDRFQEGVDADAGVEARGAGRGHDVARASHVVAQHFVGEFAHEQGAGVADFADPAPRVFDREAQMLRRESVGYAYRLVQVFDYGDSPPPFDCGARHRFAAETAQARFHLVRHALGEGGRYAYENRRRQRVVFGLRQHVGGAQRRVGAVVRHYHRFGWAIKPVYAHVAVHQLFGERDEYVAGPANHVHFGDGFGSIRHSRHRLRAADGEDSVRARDLGGGERSRFGKAAVPRGRA